jgi:hypothetical protein
VIPQPSQAMQQLFVQRTRLHQDLVRKNLLRMEGYADLPLALLEATGFKHDQSKFSEPERTAYTWQTWWYHCKNHGIAFTYPEGVEELVLQGWQHHLHTNSHHPEAHLSPQDMTNLDLVEMVCDWTAISQEQNLNGGSCMPWAKTHMAKKWRFSTAQQKLIWATIHELDRRNRLALKGDD